jgi:serine/threonine protein kinase
VARNPDPLGLLGQTIDGQYRIERPVGEGGFSVVYRAMHLGLGVPVAIKCLKLQGTFDVESNETFARRFRDEGRLLYRLGQGNQDIVRCMTSATTTAPSTGAMLPYMVLEWLEGLSFATELRERRKQGLRGRSLEEMLALVEPAALALGYAHSQGVVHRDVKPGNLFLVKQRDGGMRIKVLDFGLAKILDETVGITLAATAGNFTACSPRYAAPEQFDPRVGAIGPWTDVFSLALVLLEVLRDERVRKAEGMAACMIEAADPNAKLRTGDLGIAVPAAVEDVLARAVTFDVKGRHQSAGEFWSELTRAASETAPQASPPSSGTPSSGTGDWSRTIAEPARAEPISGPELGLGGTHIIRHLPQPQPVQTSVPQPPATPQPPSQQAQGWAGRTMPIGPQHAAGAPAAPVQPSFTPEPPHRVSALPSMPAARPSSPSAPAYAAPYVAPPAPSSWPVARPVPSSRAGSPTRPRGTHVGVFVAIVLAVAVLAACCGFLVWRVWHARHAVHGMVT